MSKVLYGQAFYSLIPKLIELIVEESLYINENSTKKIQNYHQDVMLSIIRFILKSISIKSLIKAGLRESNIEFIKLNFCQSKFLPKIIEAFSSNLRDSSIVDSESLFFKSNNENIWKDNTEKFYFENTEINLYTCLMKPNPLLYKYHRNNTDMLHVMKKIHENISLFTKNYIQIKQDSDFRITSRKLSNQIAKNFIKKLNKESNLKYRFYKHTLIVNYLTVIGVSINLNISFLNQN